MGIEIGDLIVGLLMIAFSLIGLFLAAGLDGNQLYMFGLSSVGWGAVFVFTLLRRYFGQREIAWLSLRTGKSRR